MPAITDPPGMPDDERMPGIELQTVREALGLTLAWLAAHLRNADGRQGVNIRVVQDWEAGRRPIPDQVREQVESIEQRFSDYLDQLVGALQDARDPAVVVYRSDAEITAARPDLDMPARAWRHLAYRAVHEVEGVEIIGPDER